MTPAGQPLSSPEPPRRACDCARPSVAYWHGIAWCSRCGMPMVSPTSSKGDHVRAGLACDRTARPPMTRAGAVARLHTNRCTPERSITRSDGETYRFALASKASERSITGTAPSPVWRVRLRRALNQASVVLRPDLDVCRARRKPLHLAALSTHEDDELTEELGGVGAHPPRRLPSYRQRRRAEVKAAAGPTLDDLVVSAPRTHSIANVTHGHDATRQGLPPSFAASDLAQPNAAGTVGQNGTRTRPHAPEAPRWPAMPKGRSRPAQALRARNISRTSKGTP